MKKVFISISQTLLLLSLSIPTVFAQPNNPPTVTHTYSFENPLGAGSLGEFIDALLGVIISLAVPVIALFIIYAGFLFVTARGNESQLESAKKTLLYTIIGAAVILGAKVISSIVTGTLLSL